jgi:hypothetical protein
MGIALLIAWVAESLIQRQWKGAAFRAVIALVPILLWQGYVTWVTTSDAYKHPSYAYQRALYQNYNVTYSENMEYLDPYRPELGTTTLAQKLGRVANNRYWIQQGLGDMVFWRALGLGEVPSWLKHLQIYGVLTFLVLGSVALWNYGERLIIIYLILSIVIIATTPWPSQVDRYLSPLVPLLAITFVLGLVWAARQLGRDEHIVSRRLASVALAIAATIWLALTLTAQALDYTRTDAQTTCQERGTGCGDAHYVDASGVERAYRLLYYDKDWRDFDAALDWLRVHPPRTIVASSCCPHLVYLALHSKSVMPPMETNVDEAQQLLDDVPVTVVILDELKFSDAPSKRYLRPVITANGDKWRNVFTVPGTATAIYQRTRVSPP